MLFPPAGVLLAALAGLSDLAGSATILLGRRLVGRWFDYLLAFGTGFALAIALAELLPEALERDPSNAFWTLAGFSVLFLVDRLLKVDGADDPAQARAAARSARTSGVGLTVAGVILCDFFDGVVVASAASLAGAAAADGHAASVGGASAWLLAVGLFPHNFLEGVSVALLLLAAGVSHSTTWALAIALALASLLGGVATLVAFPDGLAQSIQAFAAGLLLHLVASERIPAIRGPRVRGQALLVVAGIVAFGLTGWLLGAP